MHRSRITRLRAGRAWVLPLLAALVASQGSSAAVRDTHQVLGFLEDDEGHRITARVSVRGSDDGSYRPYPDSACVYHTSFGGHFSARDSFFVTVPAGTTRFYVSKGFEYLPLTAVHEIASDTSFVLVLDRWIDLSQEGWYSGDTHTHLAHQEGEEPGEEGYTLTPEAGARVASAEGLNVIHYLDNDRWFTGAPDPVSTADCIVYFSEEYRSFVFGHLVLMGLDELVEPCTSGPRPAWPMNMSILDTIRAQTNVAASYAHPICSYSVLDTTFWPGGGMGRELPIDALEGKVEAMDVLCYTNRRGVLDTWYHLLNSRVKILASAGTDACVDRVIDAPPGGHRVYVNLGDSSFTYDNWVAAFRTGRSFIASGPLIPRFEVEGAAMGESLVIDPGAPVWVQGEVSVASAYPAEVLEIIQNGTVVRTMSLPAGIPQVVDTTFSLLIDETCWLAARARCDNLWTRFVAGDSLMAHTNPVFIRFGEDELYSESDYWVSFLDTVGMYLDLNGEWDDPADSAFVYDRLAQARDYYRSVANQPPSWPYLRNPADGAEVCLLTPYLDWKTSEDPDPYDVVTYTLWYGTDSTFATKTVIDSLLTSGYEVEAPLADSTTYFWRVVARDVAGHEVWSDDPECPGYPDVPCPWRFTTAYDPDCQVGSVTEDPSRAPSALLAAYPNPFNPGTRVIYRLAEACDVAVRVYDVEGRLRAVLFQGPQKPGTYTLHWDGVDRGGRRCGPGVYFCRLALGRTLTTRKLVLLD